VRQGRVGWEGADEGQCSVWGEWGRGKLVRVDKVSFSFSFFSFLCVARVGGSASGCVAGAGRPSASSTE